MCPLSVYRLSHWKVMRRSRRGHRSSNSRGHRLSWWHEPTGVSSTARHAIRSFRDKSWRLSRRILPRSVHCRPTPLFRHSPISDSVTCRASWPWTPPPSLGIVSGGRNVSVGNGAIMYGRRFRWLCSDVDGVERELSISYRSWHPCHNNPSHPQYKSKYLEFFILHIRNPKTSYINMITRPRIRNYIIE